MIPIVADECVDDPIIDRLRADGYTVWSIGENIPSTPDLDVLREAIIRHSLLLTEDKDFGDLVMRDRHPAPYGIVLYRLPVTMPSSIKAALVAQAFASNDATFPGMFSVIDETKTRIRPLP